MSKPPTFQEVSRRAWAIFWIGSVGFVLSMFYRLSITVISPELTRDLNLSTAQLSQLSAAFFYAFALSQIPIGLALDSIGPRAVVIMLNVAGLAGAVFFASAQTAGQAYWARFLIGIGMSGNLMGMLTLLAAWFPAHRFATIGGLFVGIGSGGSMLAATPLALLARAFGWRGSFLLIALINALQVLAFLVFVRNHPPEQERTATPGANPFKGLWRVLKFPSYMVDQHRGLFPLRLSGSPAGTVGRPLPDQRPGIQHPGSGKRPFFHGTELHDRAAPVRAFQRPDRPIAQVGYFAFFVYHGAAVSIFNGLVLGGAGLGALSGLFCLGVFYGPRADYVFPYQGTGALAGHVHGHDRDQPLHHAGPGLYHAGHGPGGGSRAAGPEQPGRVCPGLGPMRRRPGVVGIPLSFGAG